MEAFFPYQHVNIQTVYAHVDLEEQYHGSQICTFWQVFLKEST